MRRLARRLALIVLPPLASVYIKLLRRTMRITYRNERVLEKARRDPGRFILAFWHSRFMMMPYCYPGGRVTVMVSRHRDAEMLVRTLRPFGFDFARGSSTRGGSGALRDLVRSIEKGSDAAVAPDGPRGPRRRVKSGVIAIARLSGLPILPVAFSAAPARRMRSWDRTLVPRLFSRGLFLYGEPMSVPRNAGREEQERLRVALEARLDSLTDHADRETGIGIEEPRPAGEGG